MNFIILIGLNSLLLANLGTVYNLREASAQNLIRFNAGYNPGSTHYSTPVLLQVSNISGKSITVKVPAGYLFEPNDSNVQPQVVVKEELIALQPGEQKRIPLQAMCTNATKAGPMSGLRYALAAHDNKKLTQVAEFISSKGYLGIEGQNAVWCYTNGNALTQINGADTIAAEALRIKLAEITGRPLPTPQEMQGYAFNYYAPVSNSVVRISGKIDFEFSLTKNIAIAMFNRNNVVVRELYRNSHTAPGSNTVEYEFDSSVYTEDYYKILLIADGKVLLRREMDMKKYRRG